MKIVVEKCNDKTVKIDIPKLGITTFALDQEEDICQAVGEAVILLSRQMKKFSTNGEALNV